MIIIYKIINLIMNNKKIAATGMLLYGLMPSIILYTNFCTNEFIASLLYLLNIYYFIKIYKMIDENKKNRQKIIFNLLIASFLLALSFFFKQLSVVILISEIISLTLLLLNKDKKFSLIIISVIYLLLYVIFIKINYMVIEKFILNENVNKNNIKYFLNIGLNKNSQGHWNKNISDKYYKCNIENSYDFCNDIMMTDLKKSNKNYNTKFYINLFYNKTNNALGKDESPIYWIKASSNNNYILNKNDKLYNLLEKICNIYYYVIFLLCTIGIYYASLNYFKNKNFLLFGLIIYGYSLLLLISESQERYKQPLLPFFCIMASYGLFIIIEKNKLFIKK